MKSFSKAVTLALLSVLPTVVLFEVDAGGYVVSGVIFAVVIVLSFAGLMVVVYQNIEKQVDPLTPIRNEDAKKFAVKPTFYRLFLPTGAYLTDAGGRITYVGKLLDRADKVFRTIYYEFEPLGYVPVLTENTDSESKKADGPVKLILTPKRILADAPDKQNVAMNIILVVLTTVSLIWTLSNNQIVNGVPRLELLFHNISLAIFLVVILSIAEGIRYLTAKYFYGLNVSYPLFLPVPTGFGTFGSVNKIWSPMMDRKALYQSTYAGSLAGLVIGLILLFAQFDKNEIIRAGASMPDGFKLNLGSSLLLSLAAKAFLSVEIGSGHLLSVNAQTFAGWMVVLITSVSLMPLGELAGGRITRAIFSRLPALLINRVIWFCVVGLGILHWSGWLVFAFVVFIVSYDHRTKVFNQISPVSRRQKALGITMLLIAMLVLIPLPHSFYRVLGLHCPYM